MLRQNDQKGRRICTFFLFLLLLRIIMEHHESNTLWFYEPRHARLHSSIHALYIPIFLSFSLSLFFSDVTSEQGGIKYRNTERDILDDNRPSSQRRRKQDRYTIHFGICMYIYILTVDRYIYSISVYYY